MVMPSRRYVRRPVWFKATHAAVLCLLVLSTMRAFIPGLCATLSAAAEHAEEVPACCAARMAAEAAQPAVRAPQAGKDHPPCAFCHLVLGLGQSEPGMEVLVAAENAALGTFLAATSPCAANLARANGSRAPPAHA